RNHLRLHVKAVVKKPEPYYHNRSSDNGLRNPQDYGDSKKRPTPRAVAHCLRARDECGDRIVAAKNPDLADDVSSRPRNREYAEGRRPEHPRDEKCEYAAEIRRHHGDRIQEGATFYLHPSFVYARRCIL